MTTELLGQRYTNFRRDYNHFIDLLNDAIRMQHDQIPMSDKSTVGQIVNHADSISIHMRELIKKAQSIGLIECVSVQPNTKTSLHLTAQALVISAN